MSDIVEQLRHHADVGAGNLNYHGGAKFSKQEMLAWKAADEIERLQAVVDAARAIFTSGTWWDRERLLADLRDALRALDRYHGWQDDASNGWEIVP